jgi:hypothetical protein
MELTPGNYFLFRTQLYGPGAQTTVYNSDNPYNFGIDNDSYYVRQFNVCAPEIVTLEGRYYMAALNPNLDGVRIARLQWKCFDKTLLPLEKAEHRSQWKLKEGNLASVFTNSIRAWFHPKSDFFIGTAETGLKEFDDTLTGVIESPPFCVTASDCVLYMSGGNDLQRLYVSIIDAQTDHEYFKGTGKNDNLLEPVLINSDNFQGKRVFIRVVDRSSDPWGHINFGGIYQGNPGKDK